MHPLHSCNHAGQTGRILATRNAVCKIVDQENMKPHKVRYYLEQRDPEFAEKMAEVLCVYRKVKLLKKAVKKAASASKTTRTG
jgi:hypothetical protein